MLNDIVSQWLGVLLLYPDRKHGYASLWPGTSYPQQYRLPEVSDVDPQPSKCYSCYVHLRKLVFLSPFLWLVLQLPGSSQYYSQAQEVKISYPLAPVLVLTLGLGYETFVLKYLETLWNRACSFSSLALSAFYLHPFLPSFCFCQPLLLP